MAQALGLVLFGTAAGLSIAGVALTTATGALTTAGIVFNLGVGLAISNATRPSIPGPSYDRIHVNTAQPARARIIHCGRVRESGGLLGFTGAREGVLYRVILLNHGESDAIEQIYLDGKEITLNASGYVTEDQYRSGATRHVQVLTRRGEAPSTYYDEIETAFPDWDETYRLDGITTALLIAELPGASDYNRVYPNREPNLSALLRGRLWEDPRTSSTDWTANAVLTVRGILLDPDLFNLAADDIDEASFETGANNCDQLRTLAGGGTEHQWEYHGSFALSEARRGIIARPVTACGGDLFFLPNGKIGIETLDWYEPGFTLTTDMLLDFQYEGGPDLNKGFNVLNWQFTDPDTDYIETEGVAWEDSATLALQGPRHQSAYFSTNSHAQGRALAKAVMDRENPKSIFTCRTKPKGFQGFFETRMRVTIPEIGLNAVFRLVKKTRDPRTLQCDYELHEIREDAATLTLAEQSTKPGNFFAEDNTSIPDVANFSATGGSGSITLSWDAPGSQSLTPYLQYARDNSDAWISVDVALGATEATVTLDAGTYDTRIAWKTSAGSLGGYANDDDITVT